MQRETNKLFNVRLAVKQTALIATMFSERKEPTIPSNQRYGQAAPPAGG